jgi:polyphosphate kinase
MCPVFDARLRKMLVNILQLNLNDNIKSRELQPSGVYVPVRNELPPLRSQFEAKVIRKWKSYL